MAGEFEKNAMHALDGSPKWNRKIAPRAPLAGMRDMERANGCTGQGIQQNLQRAALG
jgi:hypothetical protein